MADGKVGWKRYTEIVGVLVMVLGGVAYLQNDRAAQEIRDIQMTAEFQEVKDGFDAIIAEFTRQNEIDEDWLTFDSDWRKQYDQDHPHILRDTETLLTLLNQLTRQATEARDQRSDLASGFADVQFTLGVLSERTARILELLEQ